jgi:hypothetical protein
MWWPKQLRVVDFCLSIGARTLGLVIGLAITFFLAYPFLRMPTYIPVYQELASANHTQPAEPVEVIFPYQFSQRVGDR